MLGCKGLVAKLGSSLPHWQSLQKWIRKKSMKRLAWEQKLLKFCSFLVRMFLWWLLSVDKEQSARVNLHLLFSFGISGYFSTWDRLWSPGKFFELCSFTQASWHFTRWNTCGYHSFFFWNSHEAYFFPWYSSYVQFPLFISLGSNTGI